MVKAKAARRHSTVCFRGENLRPSVARGAEETPAFAGYCEESESRPLSPTPSSHTSHGGLDFPLQTLRQRPLHHGSPRKRKRGPRSAPVAWAQRVALAACLLLSACTQTPDPADDGPRGSSRRLEAGETCSLDLECREGLICHASRRVCICVSDASCARGEHCNPFTGACVPEIAGCLADEDCADDQWCDRSSRVCLHLRAFCESCERNAQCGPGNRCVRQEGSAFGFCGSACASDDDCPLRATHCFAGQCVPNTTCADLRPCVADTLLPCSRDLDCPPQAAQICEAGRCVAEHSGCAYGRSCDPVSRVCVPSCAADEECGNDARCVAGACHPVLRCAHDEECPWGEICRREPGQGEGVCSQSCTSDASCPLEERCVPVGGRFVCVEGCEEDADCLPWKRCLDGVCTEGFCQTSAVCAPCERCEQGRCEAVEGTFCKSCGTEGFDPTCGPGALCVNGACAPPCEAGECPSAFFCKGFSQPEPESAMLRVCVPADGHCNTECT